MLPILKKGFIVAVFITLITTIVYAQQTDPPPATDVLDNANPYVDDIRLASSRFSQPVDESTVDPQYKIDLHENDTFMLENDAFALYMNEATLGFKVLNKQTGYVWNTAIDESRLLPTDLIQNGFFDHEVATYGWRHEVIDSEPDQGMSEVVGGEYVFTMTPTTIQKLTDVQLIQDAIALGDGDGHGSMDFEFNQTYRLRFDARATVEGEFAIMIGHDDPEAENDVDEDYDPTQGYVAFMLEEGLEINETMQTYEIEFTTNNILMDYSVLAQLKFLLGEIYEDQDEAVSFIVDNVYIEQVDVTDVGSYTGLLTSGIGFEYINIPTNYRIDLPVGIVETEFEYDVRVSGNDVIIDLSIGNLCFNDNCSRFHAINLDFQLIVSLTDDGIRAHIPFESISESNPDIRLASFIVFPGLGATKMDEIPGYMLIPDGVGTLIRYEDKGGRYPTPFEERFYGGNVGLRSSRLSVTSYPLSMPIFGAVHGVYQDAFIAMIESGDKNARLTAFPNGALNVDYNFIFTKYDIRHVYRQSFTSDGSGGALRMVQGSTDDVTVRYDFIDGQDADYVGMARHYQAYLREMGHLTPQNTSRDTIPVHFQYLMADSKSTFIGKTLVEMTTVDQVETMYDYFMDRGMTNQHVSLLGWNRGGYSGQLPSPVRFERALGSTNDYQALIDHINNANSIMLVNNYVFAGEAASRVSYRTQVAQGVNRFKIEFTCNRCVYNETYGLYPSHTQRLALDDYDKYVDRNANVLFESMGSTLYSTYKNEAFTRGDSFAYYEQIFDTYEGTGQYIYPNAYMYPYVNAFYNAPLFNSQLNYFDDLVPFLPIVLSGHMDLFSQFLNYNSLGITQLLMLIDFGINPAYILTHERPSHLAGTDIEYYYSSQFAMWSGAIEDQYTMINDALSPVINASILAREVLDYGIVRVSYSNGVEIFINYSNHDYDYDGVTVEALNYTVRGSSS